MANKKYKVITGKPIEIKGSLPRHKIVRKVVNTFIATEHKQKGKGVIFRYPVENLKDGKLFIIRPGHKKNFDFKVDVTKEMELGEGTHKELALDLRKKKKENQRKFEDLVKAVSEIYHCTENDVNSVLIKWLFIMEDIIYWDNQGRAFLYNFLRYSANEPNKKRFKEALSKVGDPERLKSFMKKAKIEWMPYKTK